jgi:Glycosyltransferase WbsX
LEAPTGCFAAGNREIQASNMSSHNEAVDEGQSEGDPLVLAFYLPQFHPVPENDAWWGPGFTEWRNVVRAAPEFEGHYQPHLPGELGFYDLRLPETRVAQAELARQHGVDGFCYYHYWFGGRRILERPFDEVLDSGSPDFPFCLAWANEPWTRNWDGGNQEVLIGQEYSDEDHDAHIEYLIRAFRDPRYIKINGRPLFLIYNPKAIPDLPAVLVRWRRRCAEEGVGDPLLTCFETFGYFDEPPSSFGCDASAEFLPHGLDRFVNRFVNDEPAIYSNWVFNYDELVDGHLRTAPAEWVKFRCIYPNWDNTARKKKGWSVIMRGSTPELFQKWASGTIQNARRNKVPVVFVNAWNEWAEGTHLEPDLQYGRAYLQALARARGIDPNQRTTGEESLSPDDEKFSAGRDRELIRLRLRVAELERSASAFFAAGEATASTASASMIARISELESVLYRASTTSPEEPDSMPLGSRLNRIRFLLKNDPRPGFKYLPPDSSLVDQ